MSFAKLSNTFLILVASNPTNEEVQFPWNNVEDINKPRRVFRSTATTEWSGVLDLGSGNNAAITMHLNNVNFSTVSFSGHTAPTGVFTPLQSSVAVTQDPVTGLYSLRINLSANTFRYIKITIPNQTPVDNAAYFFIGAVAALKNTDIIDFDTDLFTTFPFMVTEVDLDVIQNTLFDGSIERSPLASDGYKSIVLSLNMLAAVSQNIEGANVQKIMDITRDASKNIWVDFNTADSWQAYVCKRTNKFSISVTAPNTGTATTNIELKTN